MSDTLSVPFSGSSIMSVMENVDYSTGVITYAVSGRRLSGAVTLYPEYSEGIDITPSQVFLESGRRPTKGERKDILTINGIQIDCWRHLNLEGKQIDPKNSRLTRLGSWENNALSGITRAHARNIVEALATLWSKRTDIADLLRAAAHSNSSKRLLEENRIAQEFTAQLQRLRAALAASEERAAIYTKLQQEHQGQFLGPDTASNA
ncbi:MAG TPA: hypothetical protein VJS64_03105 [Pyrinomonadaceae bacterium]|nr:hypothetical protein [Pyrinomonadaceae bacterium]